MKYELSFIDIQNKIIFKKEGKGEGIIFFILKLRILNFLVLKIKRLNLNKILKEKMIFCICMYINLKGLS